MNPRRAFTFSEVIAVIGIGTVVAGMMIPAMMQAKQQAAIVECASNLKQIGIATMNYAADNHNYLPVCAEEGRSPLRHGAHAMTAASYWNQDSFDNYAPPVVVPNGRVAKDMGANLFALHIQGYLGKWTWKGGPPNVQTVPDAAADPSYFPIRFCPGQRKIVSDIASQWGSSYFYNPHWIQIDPTYWANVVVNYPSAAKLGVTDPPMTIWHQKFNELRTDEVLACDMIADSASVAHTMNHWNLLFPDGHVQMLKDTYVTNSLSGAGNAAAGGNQGPTGGTIKQMAILDDYLDILETEAEGKNPLKQNLTGPTGSNFKTPLKNRQADYKQGKDVHRY